MYFEFLRLDSTVASKRRRQLIPSLLLERLEERVVPAYFSLISTSGSIAVEQTLTYAVEDDSDFSDDPLVPYSASATDSSQSTTPVVKFVQDPYKFITTYAKFDGRAVSRNGSSSAYTSASVDIYDFRSDALPHPGLRAETLSASVTASGTQTWRLMPGSDEEMGQAVSVNVNVLNWGPFLDGPETRIVTISGFDNFTATTEIGLLERTVTATIGSTVTVEVQASMTFNLTALWYTLYNGSATRNLDVSASFRVPDSEPLDLEVDNIELQTEPNRVQYSHSGSGAYEVALVQSADGYYEPGADLIVSRQFVSGSGSDAFDLPDDWVPRPELPYLLVVADPDGLIAEIDEDNNTRGVVPADFSIEATRIFKSSTKPKANSVPKNVVFERIEINPKYRPQIGGAPGALSANWILQAHWSTGELTSDIIDREDPLWEKIINVGAGDVTLERVNIPASLLAHRPSNATHLLIVVDLPTDAAPFGKRIESNESNNLESMPLHFDPILVGSEYQRLFKSKLTTGQFEGLMKIIQFMERDDSLNLITDEIGLRQAAYMLATAYHESRFTFQPVYELWTASNKFALRQDRPLPPRRFANEQEYFNYWYSGVNGNGDAASNDGYTFRGRGYIQVTGRANYLAVGPLLGFPLPATPFIGDPELALRPDYSYQILSRGMNAGVFGRRLGDFINSNMTDYVSARRSVNGNEFNSKKGLIKVHEIAQDASRLEQVLLKSLIPSASTL